MKTYRPSRVFALGFTMWMAGGGVKGGTSVGTTDELVGVEGAEPIWEAMA